MTSRCQSIFCKSILRCALLLMLAFSIVSCHRGSNEGAGNEIRIRVVHPPEIAAYLGSMVEAFHLTNPTLPDGTPVRVELKNSPSLEAARDIASGKLKTHAWFAPSLSLVNYANISLKNLGPKQIECQQLFATPIVIAVHSRHTSFFQESQRQFSWNAVVDSIISSNQSSLSRQLRFNHTSPLTSVSGLGGLIQLAYFAVKRGEGELTLEELKNPQNFERLKLYQSFISTYGFNETSLLHNVAVSKTDQILFSVTTEQQVALYNARHLDATPLIALYPSEGSYWMDYNICISEADWVPPANAAAVRLLTRFLSSEPAQLGVEKRGFRPSILALPPVAPLTRDYGIDVKAGRSALVPVRGEVVQYLLDRWPDLLRPSAMVLILDTSGSMEDAPLRIGKDYFRKILAGSSWKDQKALMSFSTSPQMLAEFTNDSEEIIPKLDELTSVGGSAVYDSLKKAFEYISRSNLNQYRKTIVIYTDGDDKNSETSLRTLNNYILEQAKHNSINLIVVAVGRDSDFSDLQQLTESASGLFRQGGLDDMHVIFAEVMANL